MPRKLRIQYPGAIYHVMSRGDQRVQMFQAGDAATQKHPRRGTPGADRQLQLCILPS